MKILNKEKRGGKEKALKILKGVDFPSFNSFFPKKNSSKKIDSDEELSEIPKLRTYQSDIAKAIKKDDVSIIKMALAEQKNSQGKYEETPKRNFVVIIISSLLIISGMLIPIVFYLINQKQSNISTYQKLDSSQLILTDSLVEIDITSKSSTEILNNINYQIKKGDLRLGNTKAIYFTKIINNQKRIGSKKDLFNFWTTKAPDSLIRSLDNNFTLGAHAFKGNQGFLIFKTNLYENSFAGMLDWEPYLARDIFNLFGIEKYRKDDFVMNQKFRDVVIKNRDARIIKNQNGEIVLLYSFPDKRTIVMAEDPQTLNDIITKLNTKK